MPFKIVRSMAEKLCEQNSGKCMSSDKISSYAAKQEDRLGSDCGTPRYRIATRDSRGTPERSKKNAQRSGMLKGIIKLSMPRADGLRYQAAQGSKT